jgi:hypothetical protein
MTPYQIEIIMFHNTGFGTFPRKDAPLYRPTVNDLMEAGVLEADGRPYSESKICTTALGAAYCEMLCATPLPVQVQVWRDPRGYGSNAL